MSEREQVIEAYIIELGQVLDQNPNLDVVAIDNYIRELIDNSPLDHVGGTHV